MSVNWYPGHMHKARKKMKEAMPSIDVVIEVLDARIPYSSSNPLVTELRQDRPSIKILNKMDLADPVVTEQWLSYFEREDGVKAIPFSTIGKQKKADVKRIFELCKRLAPNRNKEYKPVRTMIMGIPNVGKSTLINMLAGKNIAQTGNEPAVTKSQQKIRLDNSILLSDTPGILWPRMNDNQCGYRLAVTGAVKNTAIEFEDIAMFAADYLLKAYPQQLMQRFKLKEICNTAEELLVEVGKKRGGLRAGGIIDMHKASEVLLHDLREGSLGRISLETPDMIGEAVEESE